MSAVSSDWVGIRRLPSWQRTAMVGMILIQQLSLQLLIEPANFPVILLALAGWFAPQFRLLLPLREMICYWAIISFYVVRCRIVEHDYSVMGFIGTEVAYEMACCCLALQLLILFLKKYEQRLPVWSLAISSIGMVLTGDVRLTPDLRNTTMQLATGFLVCWIIFATASRDSHQTLSRRGRWPRMIVTICMMVTALAMGQQLSIFFHRHESQLERAIAELLFSRERFQHQRGFSGGGGLFDVALSKRNGRGVALRIQSTLKPDYLRGCVFDYFHDNNWSSTTEVKVAVPSPRLTTPNLDSHFHNFYWLPYAERQTVNQTVIVIPQTSRPGIHLFSPLATVGLSCDSASLNLGASNTIERNGAEGRQPYELLLGHRVKTSFDQIDPRYLQIPSNLIPYVSDLAEALAAGKSTTAEKVAAVSNFFQTEFDYNLDVHLPRTADRLGHFLTNRTPAHCEYFATATVILLRLQDIPARYVTGYVVSGKNDVTGEWVARQADAHAWVEAYDDAQQRWVTVEPTPGIGVPTIEPQYYLESLKEAIYSRMMNLFQNIMSAGFWTQNFALITSTLPGLFTLLLSGTIFYLLYRSFWPGLVESYRASPLSRERISLDRFLARKGMVRQRAESVLQFARRLEQENSLTTAHEMAEWYREYAELRFGGLHVADESTVSVMRRKRQMLAQKTKGLR